MALQAVQRVGFNFGHVRDLLLPALRGAGGGAGAPVELSMDFDWVEYRLVVKGVCATTKRDDSFVITHHSIQDGSYKADFSKQVAELVDRLRYGPIPQGAVL